MARNELNNNNDYNQESIVTGFAFPNMNGQAPMQGGGAFDPGLTVPPENAFSDMNGFGGLDSAAFGGSTIPDSEVTGSLSGATEIVDEREDVTGEKILPVAGWLVCIAGGAMGKDFRLHSGYNYIGREDDVDISIKDKKIDRESTVQIVYDSESRKFYIGKCGKPRVASRINNMPLLSDRELVAGDRIQMGDTMLIFVPFCNEEFSWPENEEE